jgi:hypothetical protein
MRALLRLILSLILVGLAATPARAQPQPQPRTLEVPANASWQHAETGLVLRPSVGGFRRSSIQDSSAEELDIMATYQLAEGGITATVYLFKSRVPDAAVWFDRAVEIIRLRPEYRVPAGQQLSAQGFTLPGRQVATGPYTALDLPPGASKARRLRSPISAPTG